MCSTVELDHDIISHHLFKDGPIPVRKGVRRDLTLLLNRLMRNAWFCRPAEAERDVHDRADKYSF
jgi:hypothetical protein